MNCQMPRVIQEGITVLSTLSSFRMNISVHVKWHCHSQKGKEFLNPQVTIAQREVAADCQTTPALRRHSTSLRLAHGACHKTGSQKFPFYHFSDIPTDILRDALL